MASIVGGIRTQADQARAQVISQLAKATQHKPQIIQGGQSGGILVSNRVNPEVESWKQSQLESISSQESKAIKSIRPPTYSVSYTGLTSQEQDMLNRGESIETVKQGRKLSTERDYANAVAKATSDMEKDNVKVGDSWIPKKDWNSLSLDDKTLLRTMGVSSFNQRKEADYQSSLSNEASFKQANIEIPGGWVSRTDYFNLPTEERSILNQSGVEGLNTYLKTKQSEFETKVRTEEVNIDQDTYTLPSGEMMTKEDWLNLTRTQKTAVYKLGIQGYNDKVDKYNKLDTFDKLTQQLGRTPTLAEMRGTVDQSGQDFFPYWIPPSIPVIGQVSGFLKGMENSLAMGWQKLKPGINSPQEAAFQRSLPDIRKVTGEYWMRQLQGLPLWEQLGRQTIGELEAFGFPAARAAYSRVPLKSISGSDWLQTGATSAMMASPLIIKGANLARGAVKNYYFDTQLPYIGVKSTPLSIKWQKPLVTGTFDAGPRSTLEGLTASSTMLGENYVTLGSRLRSPIKSFEFPSLQFRAGVGYGLERSGVKGIVSDAAIEAGRAATKLANATKVASKLEITDPAYIKAQSTLMQSRYASATADRNLLTKLSDLKLTPSQIKLFEKSTGYKGVKTPLETLGTAASKLDKTWNRINNTLEGSKQYTKAIQKLPKVQADLEAARVTVGNILKPRFVEGTPAFEQLPKDLQLKLQSLRTEVETPLTWHHIKQTGYEPVGTGQVVGDYGRMMGPEDFPYGFMDPNPNTGIYRSLSQDEIVAMDLFGNQKGWLNRTVLTPPQPLGETPLYPTIKEGLPSWLRSAGFDQPPTLEKYRINTGFKGGLGDYYKPPKTTFGDSGGGLRLEIKTPTSILPSSSLETRVLGQTYVEGGKYLQGQQLGFGGGFSNLLSPGEVVTQAKLGLASKGFSFPVGESSPSLSLLRSFQIRPGVGLLIAGEVFPEVKLRQDTTTRVSTQTQTSPLTQEQQSQRARTTADQWAKEMGVTGLEPVISTRLDIKAQSITRLSQSTNIQTSLNRLTNLKTSLNRLTTLQNQLKSSTLTQIQPLVQTQVQTKVQIKPVTLVQTSLQNLLKLQTSTIDTTTREPLKELIETIRPSTIKFGLLPLPDSGGVSTQMRKKRKKGYTGLEFMTTPLGGLEAFIQTTAIDPVIEPLTPRNVQSFNVSEVVKPGAFASGSIRMRKYHTR